MAILQNFICKKYRSSFIVVVRIIHSLQNCLLNVITLPPRCSNLQVDLSTLLFCDLYASIPSSSKSSKDRLESSLLSKAGFSRSLILILFVLFTFELKSDAADIDIDSDSLYVDKISNHAIFKGNVVVNFGDIWLKSDLIEVFYFNDDMRSQNTTHSKDGKGQNGNDGKIDRILIPGKLKAMNIRTNDLVVADRAVYHTNKSMLSLFGNVVLRKESNIIKTSEATFFINSRSRTKKQTSKYR